MNHSSWITMLLILSTSLLTGAAQAQSSGDAGPDAASENPLIPMVEDMGRRLGVNLSVEKVAINPFRGAIILRNIKASSSQQGAFLSVERLEVKGDPQSKSQEVESVDIQGAVIDLDLARKGLVDASKVGRHRGKVRRTTLKGLTAHLDVDGRSLVDGRGLEVVAEDLRLCQTEGALPVCGEVKLLRGGASLAGGAIRLEKLTLAGTIEGSRVQVKTLDGELGGGMISCAGDVHFFGADARKGIDLRCRLDGVRLRRGEALDVVASGQIRLRGRPASLKLTGDLEATEGRRLRNGTWGEASADEVVDVALTIRVKSAKGRAAARVSWSDGRGKVTLVGMKSRDAGAAERLLQHTDSSEP